MAAVFKDVSLDLGKYKNMREYTETNAFVLAVRNLLFTRPGNFPLTPSKGIDVERYLFELADKYTAETIKMELQDQINKYISQASNVIVDVQILEDTRPDENGELSLRNILGISVAATFNGEPVKTSFLMYEEHSVLNIYNEVN